MKCGRFDPPSLPSTQKLEFYSRSGLFSCVEVDCLDHDHAHLNHVCVRALYQRTSTQSHLHIRLIQRIALHTHTYTHTHTNANLHTFTCIKHTQVDSSAYAIPSPHTVRGWCDQVKNIKAIQHHAHNPANLTRTSINTTRNCNVYLCTGTKRLFVSFQGLCTLLRAERALQRFAAGSPKSHLHAQRYTRDYNITRHQHRTRVIS